jgi:tetratricopeptide (TPR) repeat protein
LVEYRERKLAAAQDDLAHAAQLAPTAERYFWLGRALEDSGSINAARDAYEAALRLAPNLSDARTRLDLIRQTLQKRS